MSWSADGEFIAFKGVRPDGTEEIGVVSALGARHGFRFVLSKPRRAQAHTGWGAQVAGQKKPTAEGSTASFPRILSLAPIVGGTARRKPSWCQREPRPTNTINSTWWTWKVSSRPDAWPARPPIAKGIDVARSPGGKRIVFAGRAPKPKAKPADKRDEPRRP